jgi:RNA 2',3'-cyclic 3'-phosphodiesterase
LEEIRCFIAIEIPAAIRDGLARVIAHLKYKAPDVKWVDPDGIHLTLKFLGSVDRARIPEITDAIKDAAAGIEPLSLEVKNLGVFPGLNRVRVVWAGVEGDTGRLQELYKRLDTNLDILGFPPESRDFIAHLTLARVRENATPSDQQELGRVISAAKPPEVGTFTAGAVSLMRSQLSPQGAIYTKIAAVELPG